MSVLICLKVFHPNTLDLIVCTLLNYTMFFLFFFFLVRCLSVMCLVVSVLGASQPTSYFTFSHF